MMRFRQLCKVSDFLRNISDMILATVCAVAFFSCNKTPEPEQVESGVRFKAQSSSFQFVKGDQIAVKGAERPFAAFVQGEDVFLSVM